MVRNDFLSGLLYPAYQKFYSAICSLKRFSTDNNFFDNISCLDTFFSEYRSTTLVMQESLAHTPHIDTYKRISEGIWDPFFNAQRVKSVHIHPVEFTKNINVAVYSPSVSVNVISKTFTVEDDSPLSSLIDSLKGFFRELNPLEVFFSAKFSFIENENKVDLWDKLIFGISTMQKFMETMYSEIGEKCELCEKLKAEIDKAGFLLLPKDFFLISDYVYYPEKEVFERASRMALVLPGEDGKVTNKSPVQQFMNSSYINNMKTPFEKFVLMNVLIGSSDLMPTIMTVYHDNTYSIDTFHADIKTTVYRKINEAAEQILSGNVKEVYFMTTYAVINYDANLLNSTSKDRLAQSSEEFLTFMKVDCELNEVEYSFDGKHISEIEYVAHQIKHGKKEHLHAGAINMSPIVEAFKTLKYDNP